MLRVPANPCWQRPILIILIERGEVPPLRVAARDLRNAGFEVDAEPFPKNQIDRSANRRVGLRQARPKSARRNEKREESGLEQHSVGLIAGEISRSADEGKKTYEANREHAARPYIKDEQRRRGHANPTKSDEHVRAAGKPEHAWYIPIPGMTNVLGNTLQIFSGRENALGTDQPTNLKYEWEKRRKINQAESAQENPARKEAIRGTASRIEEPANDGRRSPVHRRRTL